MSKFGQGNTKASKLTGVEVMQIREKYASGMYTQARLSREYHVSINTIRNVVTGVTWQDLPGCVPQEVVDEAALRSQRRLDELMSGDRLPAATAELSDDMLEAMERAVVQAPTLEPMSAERSARLAAYGVKAAPERGLISPGGDGKQQQTEESSSDEDAS